MYPANILGMNDNSYTMCRESITSPKFLSLSLHVWIVNGYSEFVQGAHEIYSTYSKVMEPTHMVE